MVVVSTPFLTEDIFLATRTAAEKCVHAVSNRRVILPRLWLKAFIGMRVMRALRYSLDVLSSR